LEKGACEESIEKGVISNPGRKRGFQKAFPKVKCCHYQKKNKSRKKNRTYEASDITEGVEKDLPLGARVPELVWTSVLWAE